MADSPTWRDWLGLYADAFGVVGGVVLIISIISVLSGWLPWPWPLIPITLGCTLVAVFIFGRVFVSNNDPLQTIGHLSTEVSGLRKDSPQLLRPDAHVESVDVAEANQARLVSLQELEEEYEPLKKLEPNFVDRGNEYVEAHNDENGVIVRGVAIGRESFHALVRSFGNEHPRNKVKPLKRVGFRLNFICFDRESRSKLQSVNTDRGAWLNEAETELEFPPHCPPRRAVIATAEGPENRVYAIRRDSDSSYKGILPLREELTGTIYTVFVALLVESRNSKSYQYILEIIREPGFELQLNDAVYWKSHHLMAFVKEGFTFSAKLHEIWKYANDQVPIDNAPSPAWNVLSGEKQPPERISFFDSMARIQAIEREQEEKLVEEIKEWETRASDWVDLFIGAEQRDKFIKSTPSIEDGFNRAKKGTSPYLLTRRGVKDKPPPLAYWTLSDAVSSRTDMLLKIEGQLR